MRLCFKRLAPSIALLLAFNVGGFANAAIQNNDQFTFGYPVFSFNVDIWNTDGNDWLLWHGIETGGVVGVQGMPTQYWDDEAEIEQDETKRLYNNGYGMEMDRTFCLGVSSYKYGEIWSGAAAGPYFACFDDE